MNLRRVRAVYLRHYYATIRSFMRILDMTLWPIVDLLLWGVLTVFLRRQGVHLAVPLGFLLGGLLLWDIVFRAKNQVALTFLEEAWSRNVLAMLASPVTPAEYLAGAVLWGLTTLAIGWALIALLAWVLFAFGIATLGVSLILLAVILLVFGVALALVVMGLVLRFGQHADIMAWALAFMVLPFSAVYYPLSALPGWVQGISAMFPTSHVFEAMRAVLANHPTPWGRLTAAAGLDILYLAAGFAFAQRMFVTLRRRGYITRFV